MDMFPATMESCAYRGINKIAMCLTLSVWVILVAFTNVEQSAVAFLQTKNCMFFGIVFTDRQL